MQNVFSKIKAKQTLSEEVAENIENAIIQRIFIPGSKLPTEVGLCEQFNVSRTTIREAIRTLNAKGLVEIRKGDGIYVTNLTSSHALESMSRYLGLNFNKDYILHLMHLRQILEPPLAELAAIQRSEEDVEFLENNIKEFKDQETDYTHIANLDLEFHLKVAQSCNNPLISLLIEPIYSLLPIIKTLIVKYVKHKDQYTAVDDHEKIFNAIKEKKPKEAHKFMTNHLKLAEKHSKMLIDSISDVDIQLNNA